MATPVLATRPKQTAPTAAVFYHPELDVLRFAAFFMVFACHAMPPPAAAQLLGISQSVTERLSYIGSCGVDLFFALSAYLITEILLREKRMRGTLSTTSFYIRRILRIWPLYYSFLGFMILFGPRFLNDEVLHPRIAVMMLCFVGNWTFLASAPMHSAVGYLWSVSVEEQFYLVWPFVVALSRRRMFQVCWAILAVATSYRVLLLFLHAVRAAFWSSTFSRLDPIALGALLALSLDGTLPNAPARTRRIVFLLSIIGFSLGSGWGANSSGPRVLLMYPLVALSCVGILWCTIREYSGVSTTLPGRILVYLGRISYGLYVFFRLAQKFCWQRIHLQNPAAEWVVQELAAFMLTVCLAMLSYRLLEQPFLRLKERVAYVRGHSVISSANAASSV